MAYYKPGGYPGAICVFWLKRARRCVLLGSAAISPQNTNMRRGKNSPGTNVYFLSPHTTSPPGLGPWACSRVEPDVWCVLRFYSSSVSWCCAPPGLWNLRLGQIISSVGNALQLSAAPLQHCFQKQTALLLYTYNSSVRGGQQNMSGKEHPGAL